MATTERLTHLSGERASAYAKHLGLTLRGRDAEWPECDDWLQSLDWQRLQNENDIPLYVPFSWYSLTIAESVIAS